MTGSWVFLQPPSPSPPPRRRKGRGRSNRSDVPAGGRRNGEEDEETVPVSSVAYGGRQETKLFPAHNWNLLYYRQTHMASHML